MKNENLIMGMEEYFKQYGFGTSKWNFPLTYGLSRIPHEYLQRVMKIFPEFNPDNEKPILFFVDGIRGNSENRWLFVSNSSIYIRLKFSPYNIIVLDCIPLRLVTSFEIIYKMDSYIKINGNKVSSIVITSRKEARFINSIVNLLMKNNSNHPPLTNYYPKQMENTELENHHVLQLAEEFFYEHNLGRRLWGFKAFFYGRFIPEDKLNAARNTYAKYDDKHEKAIILISDDLADISPAGFVLTNTKLYYCLAKSYRGGYYIGEIKLSQIQEFKIKPRITCSYIEINRKLNLQIGPLNILTKRESELLEELVNLIIQSISKEKIEEYIEYDYKTGKRTIFKESRFSPLNIIFAILFSIGLPIIIISIILFVGINLSKL